MNPAALHGMLMQHQIASQVLSEEEVKKKDFDKTMAQTLGLQSCANFCHQVASSPQQLSQLQHDVSKDFSLGWKSPNGGPELDTVGSETTRGLDPV